MKRPTIVLFAMLLKSGSSSLNSGFYLDGLAGLADFSPAGLTPMSLSRYSFIFFNRT
jgi:hypothetical protein